MGDWVTQWRVEFLGREWNFVDIGSVVVVLSLHCLTLLAPFHFNWPAFWAAVALYFVTGVSVNLSYHRQLSHRSFKLPKWLEYLFAYCAVLSFQRSPLEWVSIHRSHHQFTDTLKDPHSPVRGFWYSHMGWIFDYRSRFGSYEARLKNVGDLKREPFYIFLHYTYPLHAIGFGVVLYAVGGLPFLVWGLGVRSVVFLHATFGINSICHTWGQVVWDTGDLSRNNWLIGLMAHGEGWHNNHHAFEQSARHGLEWWQVDVTWYVIRFLEAIGLATDVKLPTETQMKRRALIVNYNISEEKIEAQVINNGKLE
ncbi:PREDICTED: palmitoyl-monogalactosyldiacylglycerol delta-7 desaturase, chloroplastic-like [Prunus mume]|uniref:Palmitoyl-monogalactosyldiacylglycerol delta-7 desaturase, chloroplastic-like n=1 Tax=Prunus mume TaxID=102107 RepID=A0ABM0NUJ7_PRUMU|nr:PREDICTED: palmitoyl-monogalactosyldiacylglycerol delta-7 desaturase, chloroplastic-like [Prunus mume]